MVTMAGTQSNFIEAVQALITLDYETIEAYETAINRLDNQTFQTQLEQFKAEQQKQVVELSEALRKRGEKAPNGPSAKRFLTKGKVALADLAGDKAILKAMHSNESDANDAYERLCSHEGMIPEFKAILTKGLADEKRHKEWLQEASQILH